jgi:hypothetical protein
VRTRARNAGRTASTRLALGIVACLLALVACGGTAAPTSTVGSTVVTSTTAAATDIGRVGVPGTHVTLVPPLGFEVAGTFVGLEHPDGAQILVAELPAPYLEMAAGTTAEALAGGGVTVSSRDTVTLEDGAEAVLIRGTQSASGVTFEKVLLMTGTSAATVFFTANIPTSSSELSDLVAAALLTVQFDPTGLVQPGGGLGLSLEPAAPLVYAGDTAGALVFNTSGAVPSADPLEPLLIVARSMGAVEVGDLESFARARLEETATVTVEEVESVTAVTIGSLEGIEIVATATHGSGASVLLYQVVLSVDEGYLLVQGRCRIEDREELLVAFRESSATLRYSP